MLLPSVSGTQLSFRANLLTADSSSIVTLVRDYLPLKSVLVYVVISDETIWMPTRILSLGGCRLLLRTRPDHLRLLRASYGERKGQPI